MGSSKISMNPCCLIYMLEFFLLHHEKGKTCRVNGKIEERKRERLQLFTDGFFYIVVKATILHSLFFFKISYSSLIIYYHKKNCFHLPSDHPPLHLGIQGIFIKGTVFYLYSAEEKQSLTLEYSFSGV